MFGNLFQHPGLRVVSECGDMNVVEALSGYMEGPFPVQTQCTPHTGHTRCVCVGVGVGWVLVIAVETKPLLWEFGGALFP